MPKISALPQLTTPQPDDYIPIVDESGTITKKINMSDLTGYPTLGWVTAGETWSYASWSSTTRIGVLTVPSDATTKYTVGMRIMITQSTGGTKYGIIVAVASTTLTVFFPSGTTLNNEAITNPFYTSSKAPYSFPADPTLWRLRTTSTSNPSTSSSSWGSLSIALTVGIGMWKLRWKALIGTDKGTDTNNSWHYGTLSSNTSSETNADLTIVNNVQKNDTSHATHCTLTAQDLVNLASQTTFTVLGKRTDDGGGTNATDIQGSRQATVVVAECALL